MVQDIWDSVDQHATFNQDFRTKVNNLKAFDFYTLKDEVDEEIRRLAYVPPRLRF